jgi:hypothetical protein
MWLHRGNVIHQWSAESIDVAGSKSADVTDVTTGTSGRQP